MNFVSLFFILQYLNVFIPSNNVFTIALRRRFSNSWVVELQPSATEAELESFAQSLGLNLMDRKILADKYYLLIDKSNQELEEKPNHNITLALKSNKKVKWVEQQVAEEYNARSVSFTDPQWREQWYLQPSTNNSIVHNVDVVWQKGYTGKHITIVVIDDGVRKTHKDFENRYDDTVSVDLVQDDSIPSSGHGTKCAGVIAAGGNNSWCGVGVAYNSRIGGIRLFGEYTATDFAESKAFFPDDVNPNKTDIFSNSWGPLDSGSTIRSPGTLAEKALKMGVEMGRNKRGSIYVFSSGNGGFPFRDSCAFDGYVNSIYTIAVASIGKDGSVPKEAERCGAIMTTVYSSDMVTLSNENDTKCVNDFGRTSAAAAFVSGIIALALEANSDLSWRDVQHLIARSSNRRGIAEDSRVKWVTNGKGFNVNDYFGFGVLDALTLVNKSEKWNISVSPQVQCTLDLALDQRNKQIPVTLTLDKERLTCNNGTILSLEHVQLRVNLQYSRRGAISIDVKSPSGTKSRFVYSRIYDVLTERTTYSNLLTTSLHFWGERVLGKWSVIVENAIPNTVRGSGTVANVTLIFYGTTKTLDGNNNTPDDNDSSSFTKTLIIVLVTVVALVVVVMATVGFYCWWHSSNSRRTLCPAQAGKEVSNGDPEIETSDTLHRNKETYL